MSRLLNVAIAGIMLHLQNHLMDMTQATFGRFYMGEFLIAKPEGIFMKNMFPY